MSSTIKTSVNEQMKLAMKAKDKPRLGVIRLILSEFKSVEVDERVELDNRRALTILDKMIKQRRDSAKQYEQAGRAELRDQENYEIDVIREFLPEPLSEHEIISLIENAINEIDGGGIQAMGQVMATLKPQMQGRADMGKVSQLVKSKLT